MEQTCELMDKNRIQGVSVRRAEYLAATARPKATVRCVDSSINSLTLRSGRKTVSFKSFSAAYLLVWVMPKQSGHSPPPVSTTHLEGSPRRDFLRGTRSGPDGNYVKAKATEACDTTEESRIRCTAHPADIRCERGLIFEGQGSVGDRPPLCRSSRQAFSNQLSRYGALELARR